MSNDGGNNFDQMSERDEDFFNEIEGEDAYLNHINSINLYKQGPYEINSFYHPLPKNPEIIETQEQIDQKQEQFLQNQHKNKILLEDLRDSTYVASNILKDILKKTENEIYSRYIDQNLNSYAVVRTLQYSQTIWKQGVAEPDDEYDLNTLIQEREDIEPDLPIKEAWIRNHADVEQKEIRLPIVEDIQRQSKMDYLGGSTTRSSKFSPSPRGSSMNFYKFNAQKPKKSKQLENSKQEKEKQFELINLEQEQEFDQYEEIYRKIKQDEQKRKEQKEEQDKIQKQEQLKVRTELKKELKSKFTYDFDGRVITQKGVKTEKLPPSHHIMHFNMKEQEQPLLKRGFQKEPPQQVELSKYAQQNQKNNQNNSQQQSQNMSDMRKSVPQGLDQQLQKILPPTKMPYNEFHPSHGVTLFYNQQIKEGPRTQETIQTFEDFEQKLKLLQPKEPMQITRSEYQRLTEKGNLVQNFKKPGTGQNTNNVLKDLDGSQSNMFKTQFGKIYEEPPSSQFSQSHILGRKTQSQFHFKKETVPSNIKVNSTKLTRNLAVDKQDEEAFEQKLKQNIKKSQSQNLTYSKQRKNKSQTPNDEFNLRLIQQPDWGKQKGGAYFPSLPKTSKQNKKIMQQTLSTLYKLPRERYTGQGFKVSKVLHNNKQQKSIDELEHINNNQGDYPYEFRGTFNSTHTKFTDTLRATSYM